MDFWKVFQKNIISITFSTATLSTLHYIWIFLVHLKFILYHLKMSSSCQWNVAPVCSAALIWPSLLNSLLRSRISIINGNRGFYDDFIVLCCISDQSSSDSTQVINSQEIWQDISACVFMKYETEPRCSQMHTCCSTPTASGLYRERVTRAAGWNHSAKRHFVSKWPSWRNGDQFILKRLHIDQMIFLVFPGGQD